MNRNELWENAAVLLAIGILLGGCAFIIAPFAPALLWAAIMAITTWSAFQRLGKVLGGREAIAASLLVGLMLIAIVFPLTYALIAFADQINSLYLKLNAQIQNGLPSIPQWIANLPVIGNRIESAWNSLAAGDLEAKERVREFLMQILGFLLQAAKIAGGGFGALLLSCILVLFFYIGGARGRFWLEQTLNHLGGNRAVQLIGIAANTIKGVVFGILGTAAVQGALAAIGFAMAGVPMPIALGLGTAVLSLIPAGPGLLWLPAAIWLYHQDETGWAIFIVLWGALVVGMVDNILKPLLIGKGTDLPLLLIMLGVFGGALNFGLLGVFIGPTFLAIGFAVLRDWLSVRAPATN